MAKGHIPMAVAYEFDEMLVDGNMQEYQFFTDVRVKPQGFWAEGKQLTRERQVDVIAARSAMEVLFTKMAT